MQSFTILPVLGLKTNVPQNDPTLFQMLSENLAVVHAVGGENFDLRRTRNSCNKSFGRLQWSANGVPMVTTGSNLMANGAAWTGATGATPPTGWAVVNAGTFTITDSGDGAPYDACLKIEVDATPTEDPTITDAITTVVGKTYKLSYAFKHGDATSGLVYIGTTSGGNEIYDSGALTDAAWTAHTYEFQATATTTYITLVTDSPTATEFELFDEVTLYELGPSTNCYCMGMITCITGGEEHKWSFHGDDSGLGRAFRWDGNRYPVRISDVAGHVSATEFSYDKIKYYSVIDFGGYMIFTDCAITTPYKSDYNDTVLTKLINAGGATEYKFRYLETFQRRIIGAYSDQTNGDIEIRWTDALPDFADLEFAAANQLYRPNDDTITGIKRIGRNACYLYGENSIDRIDYYANHQTPFGITNMVSGAGTTSQASIINAGGRHFVFDKNYGFCQYLGGSEFPAGGKPISENIEDKISAINSLYYPHIVGKFNSDTQQLIWSVPSTGSTTPNYLYIYNLLTNDWTFEKQPAWFVDSWTLGTSMSWQDLIDLGYSTWDNFGSQYWGDLVSEAPKIIYSTDGQIYQRTGENDAGSALDGFRIEPILDFGRPHDKDLLLEIWFGFATTGNFNLYVSYRGGNTTGECVNAGWTVLDEVSFNSPSDAVVRLAETNRYHQIKWGSDAANEYFSVNRIEFKFVPQGRY